MLGSSALRGVNALHGKETKQALDFGQTVSKSQQAS